MQSGGKGDVIIRLLYSELFKNIELFKDSELFKNSEPYKNSELW